MSETPTNSGRLRDLAGISAYLDMSPRYVRRLVEDDRIPVTRFAPRGRLFFDIVEIDRWIARSTGRPKVTA
jgi:hypothetical protein